MHQIPLQIQNIWYWMTWSQTQCTWSFSRGSCVDGGAIHKAIIATKAALLCHRAIDGSAFDTESVSPTADEPSLPPGCAPAYTTGRVPLIVSWQRDNHMARGGEYWYADVRMIFGWIRIHYVIVSLRSIVSTWHFDTLTSADDNSIPGVVDITKWTKYHLLLGTQSKNSGNAPVS